MQVWSHKVGDLSPSHPHDILCSAGLKVLNPRMDSMGTTLGGELPENCLCGECELRLDFSLLFRKRKIYTTAADTAPERVWTLPALLMAAKECRFCSLVLKTVSQHPAFEDGVKASAVCCMYVHYFGEIRLSGTYDPSTSECINRLLFFIQVGRERYTYASKSRDQSEWLHSNIPNYFHCIQLLAPNTLERSRDSMLLGRPVAQSQMNLNLILNWLSCCKVDHGTCMPEPWSDRPDFVVDHGTCMPEPSSDRPHFVLRLVDVTRRCVVKAPANCTYLALSYVWGGVEQLQLESGTFSKLVKDGGLPDGSQDIPKSIMDAITLVGILEEQYLWVDSLCIIQDDPEDLQLQIAQMDVIYRCAMLTIVCATGFDANAGLPGVLPDSRSINQYSEIFDGLRVITARCSYSEAILESIWETRGWTLQEKVLSKRLLIFTEHQIFYHCNAATWFEDTILENNDCSFNLQLNLNPDEVRCHKPSLQLSAYDRYLALVNGYFARDLRHESDALNAFAGLLKFLSAELGSQYIWGLPESVFDEAMHWGTIIHFPDRRNPSFPSWSWAGWKGGIRAAMTSFSRERTKAVIKWYRPNEHGVFTIIRSANPRSEGKHWGSWALKPSEDCDVGELQYNADLMPPKSHLLCFWTSSAHFLLGPAPDGRYMHGYATGHPGIECYSLNTSKGSQIGEIILDKKWREKLVNDSGEFIVISRDEPNGTHPNYQGRLIVMLIEWRDSVAYRVQLTVAPIEEVAWLEASPQWKLITLG